MPDLPDSTGATTPRPLLASIQIGSSRTYSTLDQRTGRIIEWKSAIDKQPVAGPVPVSEPGLAGDQQSNRKVHGGIDKAVLAYSADHYPTWQELIPGFSGTPGAFGENLTWSGLTEEDVCLGDRWQIGEVLLEVSQPRQPCGTLCRRWSRPTLAREVVQRGWTGWYYRVIQPGKLSAGQHGELLSRPHPEWTVLLAHRVMYKQHDDPTAAGKLAQLPVLALAWREELLSK